MILPNESKNGSRIAIQIERLILDGFNFTPPEQTMFCAALETELTRRLATGELASPVAKAVSSLSAQSINLQHALSPTKLGAQVGAAVFCALK